MVVLENEALRVELMPYGARLTSIVVKDWGPHSVILGLADEEAYRADTDYLGAVIGRYANRLASRLNIDGEVFDLEANEGALTLHGGPGGFSEKDWDVKSSEENFAVLDLISPDGDQGFPGLVHARLTIGIEGPRVTLVLEAETTRPTPVSLTAHPYFNLLGEGTIREHTLQLRGAEGVVLVDGRLMPLGEIAPLVGGALDFSSAVDLGARIDVLGEGLDHCLFTPNGLQAILSHEAAGRSVAITSDAPGVQLYTGQKLSEPHQAFGGMAIEPQSLPDGPNHPSFGDVILRPGKRFRRAIRYAFG